MVYVYKNKYIYIQYIYEQVISEYAVECVTSDQLHLKSPHLKMYSKNISQLL